MTHEILKPTFTRTDARGTLHEILNQGTWESIVGGTMNPGAAMGQHYHKETLVFFYLLSGSATVKTIDVATGARDEFRLGAQEGVIFPVNETHVVIFDERSDYLMIKSKQYDPQNPDTYAYPVV